MLPSAIIKEPKPLPVAPVLEPGICGLDSSTPYHSITEDWNLCPSLFQQPSQGLEISLDSPQTVGCSFLPTCLEDQ